MAIDSKIIRIRRGTAADFNVGKTKLVQGEFAVVTDTKEAYFAAENGEAVRLATEKDVSQLQGQNADLEERVAYIEENGVIGGGGSGIEPEENDMPKVFLYGDEYSNMTTEKNEVNMEMDYVSKTLSFHAYILIKFQGSSSLDWSKKNFTVKMYSDASRKTKQKIMFKDWKYAKHKYVLKANFIDHTHARNVIGARLWNEVVESRSDYASLPEELINSPKNGAIDGFPIKLYVNGTYQGVYTWNIGKDDWMWGMDEDNASHVLLCGETNTDGVYKATPCNFRALWGGTDGTDWSVEVGTNSTAVKNSLNALISCVKDTDDDTFKATIGNYLDLQSAIDYYIHQYVLCNYDGLGKNQLIGTYDLAKWIYGSYDMDCILGMTWQAKSLLPTDCACPEDYQEAFNLLFERIESLYGTELKTRYLQLRKSVYSVTNMFSHFERFMDIIGSDLYAEDLTIFTDIPLGDAINIKQLRDFIRDRLAYCDEQFDAMSDVVLIPATGISLNQTTLNITSENPVTLTATLSPSDSTDTITWKSSNTSIAKVVGGVVTPIANGTCTITATATSGVSATCSVSVTAFSEPIPATGITLSQTEYEILDTNPITLTATLEPSDSTDTIVWSSNDESIATVENGVVTPIGNGTCIITATASSGVSATCSVVVSGIDESVVYVTWKNKAGVNPDTGEEGSGDANAYLAEGFIRIPEIYRGQTVIPIGGTISIGDVVCFYDENKDYISGSWSTLINRNIPENAVYLKIYISTIYSAEVANIYLKFVETIIPISWSDTAEYSLDDYGTLKETGDAYLMETELITTSCKVILENKDDSTFIWKEICGFTSDNTFVKKTRDNGAVDGTTYGDDRDVTIYLKATAYPNNVATNNDPNNQLVLKYSD